MLLLDLLLSEVLVALLKEHLYTQLARFIHDEELKRNIPYLARRLIPDFGLFWEKSEIDSTEVVLSLPSRNYQMRMKQVNGKSKQTSITVIV